MSLAGTTGLIGTAVGLAVLVGVAGLAFRAVERGFGDDRGRGRSRSRSRRSDDGFFGTGISTKPRTKRSNNNRSNNNIFDLGITQSSPKKTRGKKFSQDFGSDFNIFNV